MTKYANKSMQVTTVNLPKAYLDFIEELLDFEDFVAVFGFEPSRSELVRHAVKEFIINNYDLALKLLDFKTKKKYLEEEDVSIEDLKLAADLRSKKALVDDMVFVKVPRTRKQPLGNKYYIKGVNES